MNLSLTRCAAPVHTDGGTLRCVSRRPCGQHHRRWDLLRLPAALVWALRPWWPNHLGRARDRGVAHTTNVHPCRACALEHRTYLADPYWDDRDVEAVRRRHDAGTYVPGHGPQEPR